MKKRINSKDLMANALIDLLNNYSFDEITISQITSTADVSRKTFYINFSIKEDVLIHYISTLTSAFLSTIEEAENIDIITLSTHFFDFWNDKKIFLHNIKRDNLWGKLSKMFELHSRQIIIRYNIIDMDANSSIYISSYHCAGICKILEIWTENEFLELPSDLTKYFLDAHKSPIDTHTYKY